MKITAEEAARAVGGKIISGQGDTVLENISTDSNRMKGSDLFVPIKGARVDAHMFMPGAKRNGAAAAFTAYDIDELKALCLAHDKDCAAFFDGSFTLIRVPDTRAALQALGSYYRDNYVRIPYVGITGSVGKTTVREMTACALSGSYKVYSTKGNANSQTGVPITVSETDEDAEIGVIELGMSEFGEMSRIARVVKCDIAAFTVIGVSHIGNLGSRENIMREKLHILDGMKKGSILILNGDDDLLSLPSVRDYFPEEARDKDIQIVYYGTQDNSSVRAAHISSDGGIYSYELIIDGESYGRVTLGLPGEHMVGNSLAALAVAFYEHADMPAAIAALGRFTGLDGRGRIYRSSGITVINDAYNAAPQSVKAGIKVLDGIETEGRRIAVLADMLELGEFEADYHRELGAYIAANCPHVDMVMLYGRLSEHTASGIRNGLTGNAAAADNNQAGVQTSETAAHTDGVHNADAAAHNIDVRYFEDIEELKSAVRAELRSGDAVLFKGSNSMKLGPLAAEVLPEDVD